MHPIKFKSLDFKEKNSTKGVLINISPDSEFKFTIYHNDSPAIGHLQITHNNPTNKYKGTPKISWSENIEWFEHLGSNEEQWENVYTIKNFSKNIQEVCIHFISLSENIPMMRNVITTEIDKLEEYPIRIFIPMNSDFVIYTNKFYNDKYILVSVNFDSTSQENSGGKRGLSWR